MRLLTSIAVALALSPLAAQSSGGLHAVGMHDVAWPNTSGQGTPVLAARVCYPSPTGGVDAPIAPNAAGWPVVVMLHGYSLLGQHYTVLGEAWASRGFAVVLLDTAQWNYLDQTADGVAVFGALVAANEDPGEFFSRAFDTSRVAIAGHSMGGGTLGLVLVDNPGYRCGLAFAPVFPGTVPASQVTVPFGVVVGTGDTVTPWLAYAEPYFQAVAPQSGLKFCYVMGQSCDHMNVAGLAAPADPAFLRAMDLGAGFFRHFLDLDATALEHCIGPAALGHPQLVALQQQIVQPRVWLSSRLCPGRTVRVSIAAEEGLCGVLAGPRIAAPTLTPVGVLLLDPVHAFTFASGVASRGRRVDAYLSVPNNPGLVGLTVAFQAIGATPTRALLLGAATELTIDP